MKSDRVRILIEDTRNIWIVAKAKKGIRYFSRKKLRFTDSRIKREVKMLV